MEQVIVLLGLAAAVNKTVSVIKAIGKDKNLVLTQLLVWVIGIVAILLAAHAQITQGFTLPGLNVALGKMDAASCILAGWILGSGGSFAYDFKKAIDNTDSSTEPALLPPAAVVNAQGQVVAGG